MKETYRKFFIMNVVLLIVGLLFLFGSVTSFDLATELNIDEFLIKSVIGCLISFVSSSNLVLVDSMIFDRDDLEARVDNPIAYAEGLIGLISWDERYGSWIKVIRYHSDTDWAYQFCNKNGTILDSHKIHTKANFNNFDWM